LVIIAWWRLLRENVSQKQRGRVEKSALARRAEPIDYDPKKGICNFEVENHSGEAGYIMDEGDM